MIKFDNVTKVYKDGVLPALDGVSFDVKQGEFIFLVGASGSGKSTLLSLILRAERFNSGEIHVAGRNLRTLTNWRTPEYRQKIGVVFQNFRLLSSKTVYENVAFALQVIGKTKREINQLVPTALELVGLADKADRLPDQLSGGERQRTAIARAFVNKPLIILADEPTGNLDPSTSTEIMQVFEMISQMGTTIVMATHSEEIVNTFKKRVIELRDGQIVRDQENAFYVDNSNANLPEAIELVDDNSTTTSESVDTPQNEATVALPDLKQVRNLLNSQRLDNHTVRIPKMPRKTVVALNSAAVADALSKTEKSNDAFNHFYDDSEADFFHSGTFDATQFRNQQLKEQVDTNDVNFNSKQVGDTSED